MSSTSVVHCGHSATSPVLTVVSGVASSIDFLVAVFVPIGAPTEKTAGPTKSHPLAPSSGVAPGKSTESLGPLCLTAVVVTCSSGIC